MKKQPEHPAKPQTVDASECRAEADSASSATEQHAATGVFLEPQGAMPSNTAPYNHNQNHNPIKVLRHGVDSLYLSFEGNLKDDWLESLEEIKTRAQSLDEWEQATAQIIIGNHLFNIKDKGHGFFAFQLSNPNYNLRIAKPSHRFKNLASIQFLSSAITMRGVNPLINEIVDILKTIGSDVSPPRVSRIDLCADLTNTNSPENIGSNQFVTRARKLNNYYENGKVSGWVVGQGGAISFRLYDKTLEIQRSGKDYLIPIWLKAGWDHSSPIWRAEFQLKRPILKQVLTDDGEIPSLSSLWHYATDQWLRLVEPNLKDNNRERWPSLPLWKALQSIDWSKPTTPLNRQVPNPLPPSDDRLFVHGLGPITSYMAKNNISSIDIALPRYIADARHFHDQVKQESLDSYVGRKTRLKHMQYCTQLNNDES